MSATLSAAHGSMTGVTYEQVNLTAGECIALAVLDVDDLDLMHDLIYHAGYMRGLLAAGEPHDSPAFGAQYRLITALRQKAIDGRTTRHVHLR